MTEEGTVFRQGALRSSLRAKAAARGGDAMPENTVAMPNGTDPGTKWARCEEQLQRAGTRLARDSRGVPHPTSCAVNTPERRATNKPRNEEASRWRLNVCVLASKPQIERNRPRPKPPAENEGRDEPRNRNEEIERRFCVSKQDDEKKSPAGGAGGPWRRRSGTRSPGGASEKLTSMTYFSVASARIFTLARGSIRGGPRAPVRPEAVLHAHLRQKVFSSFQGHGRENVALPGGELRQSAGSPSSSRSRVDSPVRVVEVPTAVGGGTRSRSQQGP